MAGGVCSGTVVGGVAVVSVGGVAGSDQTTSSAMTTAAAMMSNVFLCMGFPLFSYHKGYFTHSHPIASLQKRSLDDLAKESFRSAVGLRQGGVHHHHLAKILNRQQPDKAPFRIRYAEYRQFLLGQEANCSI
jgi:hypothetical protein